MMAAAATSTSSSSYSNHRHYDQHAASGFAPFAEDNWHGQQQQQQQQQPQEHDFFRNSGSNMNSGGGGSFFRRSAAAGAAAAAGGGAGEQTADIRVNEHHIVFGNLERMLLLAASHVNVSRPWGSGSGGDVCTAHQGVVIVEVQLKLSMHGSQFGCVSRRSAAAVFVVRTKSNNGTRV
jgi:hypothetical protein